MAAGGDGKVYEVSKEPYLAFREMGVMNEIPDEIGSNMALNLYHRYVIGRGQAWNDELMAQLARLVMDGVDLDHLSLEDSKKPPPPNVRWEKSGGSAGGAAQDVCELELRTSVRRRSGIAGVA